MCGLAGIVNLAAGPLTDDAVDAVARMCAIQNHRGPDDRGTAALGGAVLGSNRLSIIDLSAAGHMPMPDQDRGRWIAYNGEVYNFAALRAELERRNHRFVSRTDTEVVLHAYAEWGNAAFERFVGMFALAIWDSAARKLVLARDRFGKKPLYFAWQGDRLLFASEIKALIAVMKGVVPNQQRLIEWSLYRNVDFGPPATLFEGISALPAGCLLEVTDGVVGTPERYYQVESRVDAQAYRRYADMPATAVADEFEALVRQGIADRLVSDVPVGTLCSGGVDSSLITALAAQGRKDLLAFHVSVAGKGAEDERPQARAVTESLGIRLLTLRADGESFRSNFVRAIYFSDQPLTHPNSVFFLLISEFARSHGVKVLLSGEAADELFGGYAHRYRRFRQYQFARKALARLPGPLRIGAIMAGLSLLDVPMTELTGYDGLVAFSNQFLDRYSRAELHERCTGAYAFVADESDRGTLGSMLADLSNFLAPLLRRLDRMSMAASVECRAPFLDHRLVEAAINLPLALRLRGRTDKWALKAVAERHLPRRIVHRRKVGFPLPLADYLAPLASAEVFKDGFCVGHLGLQPRGVERAVERWRDNVNGFCSLLALEIWGRLYFLGSSVAEAEELLNRAARRVPGR